MGPPGVIGLALFASLLSPTECGYSWGGNGVHKLWPGAPSPEFEQTPQNIIVTPGQTAVLPCRVRNLADKVVSWIRRRDLHIISSGSLVFTGDSRFRLIHPLGDSSAWELQLRGAEPKDQGLYECQINTDPKMKRGILLTVTEKTTPLELSQKDDSRAYGTEFAEIPGPKDRYVKIRSSLNLNCHYSLPKSFKGQGSTRQPLVEWLHENNPLSIRSGVKVETQKEDGEVRSSLTLGSVGISDSGTYTCRPSHGRPSTVTLFVIEGEHSEAMQGDYVNKSNFNARVGVLMFFSSVICSIV